MTRAFPLSMRATRLALGLVVAGAVLLAAGPALAQTAGALGKPLPSPDLAIGTVSVRIVAGSPQSPVVGTDVTLLVNGAPRVARTDAAGRAMFAGLPAGAKAIAKVIDSDKIEHASDEFQIPGSGGTRLLISTKPWQAGAGGGAPPVGGAGGAGMPNPRQMSGEPRAEQSDPPGTITVRLVYDDFNDTPEGVPVVLVGYAADSSTSHQVVKTDRAGRVTFTNLDRSGGTSYFAMAQLPRNGAVDRLVSAVIVLDTQMGVRLLLSSDKRSSTAPPIDDLARFDAPVATPAGKVRVSLEGMADVSAVVTVVDAATRKVLAEARPTPAPPDPSRVQGGAQFEADAKLPAGTLDVDVRGGPGATDEPLRGIEVRVLPASSQDPTAGLVSPTGADGTVRMALQVTEPQKAVFTINGRPFASQPFDLAKSGGKLTIRAQWEDVGRPEALVDVTAAGQVVYAECQFRNKHYRSMPFQLLEAAGSKITVYVVDPRVLFGFRLDAVVEDEYFAVRGRFEVRNYSWSPYRAGPDGLLLPLPRKFMGAVVAETDQADVAPVPGEGFRIVRPIPPGGRPFNGAFSLSVVDGNVEWDWDLPMGSFDPMGSFYSQLIIRQTPGMLVHTPPGVRGESRTVPEGTFYLISPIQIRPMQSMAMSIEGLPSPPAWRTVLPGVVGVFAVAMMLTGLYFALRRPRTAAPTAGHATRRQRLLDELVELERTGANPRRRDQLIRELEELWG